MQNEALYNKTVDILVQAYFNDTLEHQNCAACAVGNLIAANNKYVINKGRSFWKDQDNFFRDPLWKSIFSTPRYQQQYLHLDDYKGLAKIEIDSTGYALQELAKIEFAFETAPHGNSEDEWMFNGLMAVLSVLNEIHQVEDEIIVSTNSKRFEDVRARNMAVCG